MSDINPRHLETLKAAVLSETGLKVAAPGNCRVISFAIMHKTKLGVSETTIKRLYGFAICRFSPSVFTLNALAIYCGYDSWAAFAGKQPGQPAGLSETINDPLMLALLDTPIPSVLLRADDAGLTIVAYNQPYETVTNLTERPVKGIPFWEAFDPKQAGGYGPTLLMEAFHEAIHTQRPVQMEPLHYNISSGAPNGLELAWWDVRVAPVSYDSGVRYLFMQVHNITDRVVHQDAIEMAIMRELTLTEDLAKTNVKLAELNTTLEQRVFERTQKLFESETKQRALIDNAPVAIAVLKGPEHVIDMANQKIIAYWGKTGGVIGKPLATALPELEGQPFIGILDEVRASGVPYINAELEAFLDMDGQLVPRYFDMIYQPIQHTAGITDSIFIVAVDITDSVSARQQLKESESMLRLAVTAARMGIWSLIPFKEEISYNPMFAEIMGWEGPEHMTYEQAMGQAIEPDRERITAAIARAIAGQGDYDVTYQVRHFNDGRIVKVRAVGNVTLDDSGTHQIFSGVLQEVPPDDNDPNLQSQTAPEQSKVEEVHR